MTSICCGFEKGKDLVLGSVFIKLAVNAVSGEREGIANAHLVAL